MRLSTRDVNIGGVTIPPGSVIAVLLGSANRDEAHFPEAERFELDRDAQGVVAFGHGVHFCLGAALARAEARLGLQALLSRFQGFLRVPSAIGFAHAARMAYPASICGVRGGNPSITRTKEAP